MRTPGTSSFRLRDIALAAYAPSAVSSLGFGAVIPVLALRARDLGAGVDLAALIVALLWRLCGDIGGSPDRWRSVRSPRRSRSAPPAW